MKRPAPTLDYRWFYVQQNLQLKENVTKVQGLLQRAKAAGYNGMVLADYKLSILDRVPDFYFANLAAVKKTADALGIGIFPTVCSCGYDSGLLAHDPNLAEGLPVRDAIFTVKVREAQVVSQNLLTGWDWNDGAAKDAPAPSTTTASLRFDKAKDNVRASKKIAVESFRQFHLSIWIKTADFPATSEIRCIALTGENKPSLCQNNWTIKPTQDWTEYHAVFNTLDNRSIQLYVGCWGAQGGTLWLGEARLEEVGFLNVVRRAGCPLTVKSDDGILYTEGRDYETIADPRLGNVPYEGSYEVWHAPPPLKLTPNSRITDGQRLRVSFHHAVCVYDDQVAASLVDPKVFALHAEQLRRIQTTLAPPGLFFSHDELRVANWSADCLALNKTAGQLLAAHLARCSQLGRKHSPKATQFVWSDMFDPHHNAKDNYYLVRGTLAGSWNGLPKEMIVVNWNSGKQKESLGFFSDRGNRQILAGYYDGSPDSIKAWLATAQTLGGARVVGAMYTTWRGDYSQLEAFARAAWGALGT